MRIAYLTRDEVNAAAARALAGPGVEVVVLDVRQTDPKAVRLVCDLDHLPAEMTAGLLTNARAGVDLSAVSAHSYRLTRGAANTLRAAGARVARRLSADLFAARPRRTNGAGTRRVTTCS